MTYNIRWKLTSYLLISTLVIVTFGVLVYLKLPISYVTAQAPTNIGKSQIGVAPRIISYQGYLRDSTSGQPVTDGDRTAIFRLYTSESSGSVRWQETKTITTRNGVFKTILGQQYPINPSLVAVPELWLGVRLPPDDEMSPRQRITGSVYSVGAAEAQVSETVAVSGEQIALRKWYDLNLGRPDRIDVAYAIQDRNNIADKLDVEEYPTVDNYGDVHSLGVITSGNIIYNAGNVLAQSTAPQRNPGGALIWVPKCYSITTLGHKIVCATDSQLMIMASFEPPFNAQSGYRTQSLNCSDCRFTAYDGKNLWASDYIDGKVRKFDLTPTWSVSNENTSNNSARSNYTFRYPYPDNPSLTGSYDVGSNPMGIEFDGENIWVANNADDTVSVIDTSDNSTVATISVGDQPTKVLFDGSSIWVLNTGDETITKIDSSSQAIAGTYSTGSTPSDISFDGSSIWIANTGDSTISRLRASDGTQIDTLPLTGAPYVLKFDGVGTWIATKETQPTVTHNTGWSVTGERWFVTRY